MTAVPKVQMLINGHFLDSNTSHYEDVLNPATQQVLAQVPLLHGR
jgi:malonate-semialdehyde dehydrogenase (acetylating)/methylmalonate-semialdehyde dehydrogenase